MAGEDKTFTVAGTSIKNGVNTNRFANGTAEARAKVLQKDNHADIKLFNLPNPMTKDEALKWLEAQGTTIAPVNPGASAPRESRAPREPRPATTSTSGPPKQRINFTGRTRREYSDEQGWTTLQYTPEELEISPIARAVHEAGFTEIKLTAEQEADAMRLHKLSVVSSLAWPRISVQARNEFRATVLYAPIDPQVAREQAKEKKVA